MPKYLKLNISSFTVVPLIAVIMGIIIFCGTAFTEKVNRLLTLGLVVAYILLISAIAPKINYEYIGIGNIETIPRTIPLIITTFGFAIVIPTLCNYLKNDDKGLHQIIILGSLIPLVVYILWELATIGVLSIPGESGLASLALQKADGTQVAYAIQQTLSNSSISALAYAFSVFAITTSFFGVALSLFHFLADGLKSKPHGFSGFCLALLTFIPPILLVIFYPSGFDNILQFGGIFVAILLGILPVAMVWSGRYKHKIVATYKVKGGKSLLILTGLFFIYTVFQELFNIATR